MTRDLDAVAELDRLLARLHATGSVTVDDVNTVLIAAGEDPIRVDMTPGEASAELVRLTGLPIETLRALTGRDLPDPDGETPPP